MEEYIPLFNPTPESNKLIQPKKRMSLSSLLVIFILFLLILAIILRD